MILFQGKKRMYAFSTEEKGRTADARQVYLIKTQNGLTISGQYRTRTCDPYRVKIVL